MPPPASESDNYKLLWAIVEQIPVKNINWNQVAQSLGVEKTNTVQKRWSVLKKKEGLGQNGTSSPTPRASPKKRANEDDNGTSGGPAKKSKAANKNVKIERSDAEEDVGEA